MTLNVEDAQFEYHTKNSERLIKDFLNFVVTDIPFFALQEELLYLMNHRGITQFRIPAYMTVDSQEHIFYFKIKEVEENQKLRTYQYLGMDIKRRPQPLA
ncbi:DUF5960 family protein [Enterococcus sp. LJL120]